LDSEKKETEKIKNVRENYEEIIPYLQQQFFIDLLNGACKGFDDIEKRRKLAQLEFSLTDNECYLINLIINGYDYVQKNGNMEKTNLIMQ
jgi:hypothetical protein